MTRLLIANICLFLLYVGNGLLGTWLYVRSGQPLDSFLYNPIFPMLQATSLPVAIAADCRILYLENRTHWLRNGAIAAAVSFALALFPYGLIIIGFHLAIGGTL